MAWQGRFDRLFIEGGEWVAPTGDKRIEVALAHDRAGVRHGARGVPRPMWTAWSAPRGRPFSTTAHGRAPGSTSGSWCCAG